MTGCECVCDESLTFSVYHEKYMVPTLQTNTTETSAPTASPSSSSSEAAESKPSSAAGSKENALTSGLHLGLLALGLAVSAL